MVLKDTLPPTRRLMQAGLALLALGAGLALASPKDHDRALQAFQRGEVLSLQALLDQVPTLKNSQILEVELERHDGRWVYEIKSLEDGGRLVKRKLDARTGALLSTQDKGTSPGGARP